MNELTALDLFCGQGGASMGLHRAGFTVTGVDIIPQPNYPFRMYVKDALTFPIEYMQRFDLIWASPPCQFASILTPKEAKHRHDNLIHLTRERLEQAGVPYIIENVKGAKEHLDNPIMLCGTMFGLKVWRHRYFEVSFMCAMPGPCKHDSPPVLVSGTPTRKRADGTLDRTEPLIAAKSEAMGIDWMTTRGLDEAIPPAYSEHIAKEFMNGIL